jgi:DNA-binding PadR family transcriptional regulator
MAESRRTDTADHLPLRPIEFQVLVLLADGAKHGWAILQAAEAIGPTIPGIATLYRTLQRLEDAGLIERRSQAVEDDDRRRVYGLTRRGRAVAAAEARRLRVLLGVAKDAKLLDDGGAR